MSSDIDAMPAAHKGPLDQSMPSSSSRLWGADGEGGCPHHMAPFPTHTCRHRFIACSTPSRFHCATSRTHARTHTLTPCNERGLNGPSAELSETPNRHTMMWRVVILLSSALSVESYVFHDQNKRLSHGQQLKINLERNAQKLEFTPASDFSNTFLYWDKGRHRPTKGKVSGTGSDQRWYISKVTYEDEGTYTQRDFWNKRISVVKVSVKSKRNYVKRVPGESLYVSLEGIELADATLLFSGEAINVTLVSDGAQVSQDLPDYWDRVRTHNLNIEILNVNTSDVGRYILKNRMDRVVSVIRMDLTDHHESPGGHPLMALLLLLGIPAGICCCCRKKIFKQKSTNVTTAQSASGVAIPPASGPFGPSPPYHDPGQPVYYHGQTPGGTVHPPPPEATVPPPAPGFNPAYPPQNPAYPPQNPAYPPQNPAYPPAGPAMVPPTQPQWNGPPPGQYPPGPGAPMGYASAPVMYHAPPPAANEPVKEDVKMENLASSPADPLLTSAQQAEGSSPVPPLPPSSTEDALKFQIYKDSSSSFL
ncbi:hypothetical protein LDENG_00097220 [Lucifuga dentata]|nr:hypothetical protein LDENG_00097220 [Lucifuga dentata]